MGPCATTLVSSPGLAVFFMFLVMVINSFCYRRINLCGVWLPASSKIDCEGSRTWRRETDFRNNSREHRVLRAANAHFQPGDYCRRADDPYDSDHMVIRYLDGL